MSGFILYDKPAGITSHDVVDRVRRQTGQRCVGHAGTLDPFATGLLIVGVGREATREFPKLVGLDKIYEATFVLGATSDTDDRTGNITPVPPTEPLTHKRMEETLKQFVGEISQIPPDYSAIKINGQKMYEAAREGKPLEAAPRKVTIYAIDLLSSHLLLATSPSLLATLPSLLLRIHCSSGTYIRAIARDLGRALGTGGYVEELRRTHIGPFSIESADNTRLLTVEPFFDIFNSSLIMH